MKCKEIGMAMVDPSAHNLHSVRLLTLAVIIGLVLSGLTAFPLRWELDVFSHFLVGQGSLNPGDHHGLAHWILKVREGLSRSYEAYPFLAYGTDWLAFGHLVIALFFVPVFIDPIRYRANVWVGLVASVAVFPLAFVCGPIRGIPFYWQLIDSSFGVGSGALLFVILRLTARHLIDH